MWPPNVARLGPTSSAGPQDLLAAAGPRSLDHPARPPRTGTLARGRTRRIDLALAEGVEERLTPDEEPPPSPNVGTDLPTHDHAPRGAGALEAERTGDILGEHHEGKF
jgi:hypothetical protein